MERPSPHRFDSPTRPRPRVPAAMLKFALLLAAMTNGATMGQHDAGSTPPGESESPLEPHRPADLPLEDLGGAIEPLVVETLGLAMLRPRGAEVAGHKAGSEPVITLGDGNDPPSWTMSIQRLLATSGGPTPASQLEAHFAALKDTGQSFTVLLNEPREISGRNAQLCFLELPMGDNEPVINGWLIVPTGERLFLILSTLSTPATFDQDRRMFEAMFSTIHVRSTEELAQRRMTKLKAGRTFLESIQPEQLRELVGRQIWTRVYRPANDARNQGEQEIGYAHMQIREGRRGELNPERPENTYSREERLEGLFVRIQGRVIGDLEREVYFDSIALYWMAWDQSSEAWSVRGTQRQREASVTEAETGLRLPASTGNPRPTLTVIHTTSSLREPYEWSVPDSYLSQALGPLIGQLLPMNDQAPRELAYYHYHNAQGTPQLTQRIDEWSPLEDGSGRWRLTTRMGADGRPIENFYGEDRMLLRREMPNGVVVESITLPELRRLWERKNLPLGTSSN